MDITEQQLETLAIGQNIYPTLVRRIQSIFIDLIFTVSNVHLISTLE
ncbi:MAG: hypothetical protein ABI723_23720 [Bacteroidia bacterium]